MEVKSLRALALEARKADYLLRGSEFKEQLENVYAQPDFREKISAENIRSKIEIIYFLGKWSMNYGDFKSVKGYLNEARDIAKKNSFWDLCYRLEAARGYFLSQDGTKGGLKHSRNILNKLLNETKNEANRYSGIRACAEYFLALTHKLTKMAEDALFPSQNKFSFVLNLSLEQLKDEFNKNPKEISVKMSLEDCRIWLAIQEFRKRKYEEALNLLENLLEENILFRSRLRAKIQIAFILAFVSKEFKYSSVIINKFERYLYDIEPYLRVVALLTKAYCLQNKERKHEAAN